MKIQPRCLKTLSGVFNKAQIPFLIGTITDFVLRFTEVSFAVLDESH
jgi:hypothetical protein